MAMAALMLVGTVMQVMAQQKMTQAMKDAENARKQQLALDTTRRNREAARKGIVQMAMAEYNAFSQGAQGGSGLPGGLAQISGDVGRTQVANNQNKIIGDQIFAANQRYYDASTLQSFGVGLSSLAGGFMSNAGTFNRIGGGAFA